MDGYCIMRVTIHGLRRQSADPPTRDLQNLLEGKVRQAKTALMMRQVINRMNLTEGRLGISFHEKSFN